MIPIRVRYLNKVTKKRSQVTYDTELFDYDNIAFACYLNDCLGWAAGMDLESAMVVARNAIHIVSVMDMSTGLYLRKTGGTFDRLLIF